MASEEFEPRPKMFDIETGTVMLRLVPFHLDRIHGNMPAGHQSALEGLPFPFLPGGKAVDIELRGGMSPMDLQQEQLLEPNSSLGNSSWQRWHAYAITSFGWCAWPTPFFKSDKLSHLQMDRWSRDEESSFDIMKRALVEELGTPKEDGPRQRSLLNKIFLKPPEYATRIARWEYPWGRVDLGYEPRDWTAVLGVSWNI